MADDTSSQGSSWDDLLKQIGASSTSDAAEKRRPAIETQFEPRPATRPAAPPKAASSDWGALANELGIEAPEPPAPVREVEAAKAPAKQDRSERKERPERGERSERRERQERPRRGREEREERPARNQSRGARSSEPTAGDLESSFAGMEPIESDFEEVVEEEIADIEFGEGDELLEDFGDIESEDFEGLTGEAARDAFEALFQTGGPPPLPPLPRREPRARERGRHPSEEPERSLEFYSDPGEGPSSTSSESEGEGDGERRGRRRRGRGRGRGRSGENREGDNRGQRGSRSESSSGFAREESEVVEDSWGDELDLDRPEGAEEAGGSGTSDEGGERKRRRRRGRGRGRGRTGDDSEPRPARGESARKSSDEDDDDDDAMLDSSLYGGDSEEDQDDDAKPGSHKSIPSWSDAVGVVVEVNMNSRKNSPSRPSASRGGRPRGGRRRRKS